MESLLSAFEHWIILVLAGLASLFMLLAAWGNLTLGNAIARMHGAGLGSTLGMLLLLAATGLYFRLVDAERGSLLLMGILGFFLLLTSPVATTAMTRAAFRSSDSRERRFLALNQYPDAVSDMSASTPRGFRPKEETAMEFVERQGSDSGKWSAYDPDVLPLWVADMDFKSPQVILDALHARVDHGVFGYGGAEEQLAEVLCAHLHRTYQWEVAPSDLVFLPGLVCGLNVVSRAVGEPGAGIMSFEPIYPPFLNTPTLQSRQLQAVPLHYQEKDGILQYYFELDDCRAQADESTALFLLCNPHNPVGRSYTRDELLSIAEFCLDRGIVLCSDEIHCDLLLDDTRHMPVASLSPEIARNTVTLMAPSKTFNLPGLGCSVAIVQNPVLKQAIENASAGIVPHVNVMGYVAGAIAYGDPACLEWLADLRQCLTDNRNFVETALREAFPAVRMTRPESTYLGWIDFSAYVDNPYRFFHNHAQVALSQGDRYFSRGGRGFARLNFGTSREILGEAIDRMKAAMENR